MEMARNIMHRLNNILILLFLITITFPMPRKSFASIDVSLSNKITAAQHALIQGETEPSNVLIKQGEVTDNYNLMALEILYLIEQEKTDEAEEKLIILEKQFSEQPETFAFSAEVWRAIAHQASIFSKRGYYKKAVQARIKAGQVAPNNPRYLTMQASALGQGKSYGGDESEQKSLTSKIVQLDKKWGYIAQINLAQNSDDYRLGEKLSSEAAKEFKDDFDVLERVGKFYWTMNRYDAAQQYFLQACKAKPSQEWYIEVKWFNACYLVATFAQEESAPKEKGITALNILLQKYPLPTQQNFDIARLLLSISNDKDTTLAKQLFSRILKESDNKKLKAKAEKELARIDKQ